jgi:methionyl-tRNA formyltransferase
VTDRTRAVFLGSGEFAVAPAQALLEHPAVEVVGVVTAPPRPAGRGRSDRPTPVGAWAADHGLRTLTPARLRSPDSMAQVVELGPDLLVLADYGQLVPGSLVELPRHGALNLHPSLLPRHRGASPIPAAILAGDAQTGVTLMRMDAGLDTGPIVVQRALALRGDEVAPDLEHQLSVLAAQLLGDSLADWLAGRIEPRPQPTDGVTLTRPLRREDGRLDPSEPAVALERQVRAYQPWPGSWLEIGGERVVVWRAMVVDGAGEGALALPTVDDTLELIEVQPAGGRRMSGAEFARGRIGRLEIR